MPIAVNGTWVPYGFSNCALKVINGTIQYTSVTVQQLNVSGLLCSISYNFNFFFPVLTLVLFVVCMFLFSYATKKAFIPSTFITWLFATILTGYGWMGFSTWMIWTVVMIAVAVYYIFSSD